MRKLSLKNTGNFLLAVILPLIAFGLEWVFWPVVNPSLWLFYYPAVFFSSWVYGLKGAIISILVSTVSIFYFIMPLKFSSTVNDPGEYISIGIFVVMGMLFGYSQELLLDDIRKRKKIAAALRESEEKYRHIVETTHEGIMISSPGGEITFVNARFAEMSGYSSNELLGKNAGGFLSKDHTTAIRENGKIVQEELKLKRKDDSIIWTLYNSSPMYDAKGNYIGNLATHTDITARKKLEEELILSEQLHNLMITHLPNSSVHIIDKNLRFIRSGGSQLIKFGLTDETLRGKTPFDVFSPEITSVLKPAFVKALKGEETECETFFNSIYLLNIFVPIPHKNGTIDSVLVLNVDVTNYRKAERELLMAKEKLNLVLENANIGVWDWDFKSNELNLDGRMEKIFDIKQGTFSKTFAEFEKYIHDEDLNHFKEAVNQALKDGNHFETVFRTKSGNGNSKYISTKAIINKSRRGKMIGLTGVCFDVTSMKKGTEKVLFKLNEELMRSNKDLQQFAYVASHDLQEPLRMVSSFTQMLEHRYSDKLDDDGREYIKFAVDGSKRMYNLLNGLLAYSRVQSKMKEFDKINMTDILEKVIKNLRLVIEEKQVVINYKKLPVIFADDNQMIQLVQNLIENGIKFSTDTPRITISSKTENEYHVFYIKDEGIGIDPQYFQKIFMIFQRLHQMNSEGTGIGLAICKRIVERHGGRIWVESEPGKGTCFIFTIPRYPMNLITGMQLDLFPMLTNS